MVIAGGLWYKNSMSTKTIDDVMKQGTKVTPSSNMTTSTTEQMSEDTKEITIEGAEFSFTPTTLRLKKGETVKLTLKNIGKMPHDFVIDELNVRTKIIKGGETDTIEFTPENSGTFEYYCSVGSHRAMGMKGMLTVE